MTTADHTTRPLDVAAVRARADEARSAVDQTRFAGQADLVAHGLKAAMSAADVPDLLDALAAAHKAYELKVQDLAAETARLGKLVDVLALHGHHADDTSRRCVACSICRALREVTGQEAPPA